MVKLILETGANLERVKSARSKQHDVLLLPVFAGKAISLVYDRGVLPLEKFTPRQQQTLKAARVPTTIGVQPGKWVHFKCQTVTVNVVFAHHQFIAMNAVPSCGAVTNRLTTLNILHKSGFRTPLGYVKWLSVAKAKHRSEVEGQLRSYLDEVNAALSTQRTLSGAISNFTAHHADTVEVDDVLGFQPDESLGARAQSVYKLAGES